MNKKHLTYLIIGILAAYFIFISTLDIDLPWNTGHHGFVGGMFSEFAINDINFDRHDFAPIQRITEHYDTSLTEPDETFDYYIHHPTGIVPLIFISFKMFGIHEWSARLVAIILNAITMIFLYLSVKKIWNTSTALLSVGFFMLTPAFIFLRNFVSCETAAFTGMSLLLYVYISNYRKEDKSRVFLFAGIYLLASFVADWQLHVFVVGLLIHRFIFVSRFRLDRFLVIILLTTVLFFAIFLMNVKIMTGSFNGSEQFTGNLYQTLLFRLGQDKGVAFSGGLLIRLYNHFSAFFKLMYSYWPLLMIALLLLASTIFRFWKMPSFISPIQKNFTPQESEKLYLFIILLLLFTIYLIIFNNLFLIHGFLIFFLLPWIAVLMARFATLFFGQNKILLTISVLVLVLLLTYSTMDSSKMLLNDDTHINPFHAELTDVEKGLIVSFYGHPSGYADRFYFSRHGTRDARTMDTFLEIMKSDKKYKYFILDKSQMIYDQELIDYMYANHPRREVDRFILFDLELKIGPPIPTENNAPVS